MADIKFKYNFFLNRSNLSLEQFLSGCIDLQSAKEKVEKHNLFGLSDEKIIFTLEKINEEKNVKAKEDLDDKSKTEKKKVVKRRPRRKSTTTRKRKTKQEKDEDVSYFATWKVPYVEP